MKEPKIRFKGFEGEWENPTIANTFAIRNGYTPSKAIKAFWDGGTIPWFRMEDIRENGGILKDAIQHITPLGVKGDGLFETNSIILATTATIGVHAMLIADSLANQQFTNFSIRKSLKDNYNPMFVYYSFFGIDEWCKKNTNSGGLLAVNIPYLLKQSFHTPTLPEQQSIASFFQHLDSLIQSTTKKIESLKQVKAASLQSMFPQEGETTPRVRFKGFEGEWEKVTVSTLLEERREFEIMSDEYPLKAFIAYVGVSDKGERYDRSSLVNDVENKVYKKTELGDFIYSSNNLETGSIGLNRYGKATISPVYSIFKCTEKSYSGYIGCAFTCKDFINKMVKWRQGVMYGQWRIHELDFLKIDIFVPSFDEQRCIGNYFTTLDRQITLQTQRLEKLKQIKAACLDNMFV